MRLDAFGEIAPMVLGLGHIPCDDQAPPRFLSNLNGQVNTLDFFDSSQIDQRGFGFNPSGALIGFKGYAIINNTKIAVVLPLPDKVCGATCKAQAATRKQISEAHAPR